MTTNQNSKIVVGVDGSDSSLDALRWAVRQGGLTGATVEAVYAWNYPTDTVWAGMAGYMPAGFDVEKNAKEALAESVAKAVGTDEAELVRQTVVNGVAASVLLDAVAPGSGAELLVIGERGFGPVRITLIGSVSHAVIHHAHLPVVVVRAPETPAA